MRHSASMSDSNRASAYTEWNTATQRPGIVIKQLIIRVASAIMKSTLALRLTTTLLKAPSEHQLYLVIRY